ncbi:MAG: tRNA 2-thiouridine(34) synthase MnmA [Clostridiaceae bacterium]|nr:tRNA 2-thiouridine(34) synthase MnmA [Clostridiaceae bacterium]
MNKKVVVGMSGGVDSSVAAYLLKQQGYEVIGVTMEIWQPESAQKTEREGGCCGLSAVEDARRVAHMLDIPHYVMNFREDFQKSVIDYFVREYQAGRTPNPCIACNRYVKWESLLQRSFEIGADYIATGHYARICRLDNGRYAVAKSKSAAKDQTYALYNLTQKQLEHTLMPVGEYDKAQIRQIAAQQKLLVADKPDSQEICFIPDNDYNRFLEEETGQKAVPGDFVDQDGKVLGTHQGISHYTIGQRKGLQLAMGHPVFVTELRPESNQVVIGENDDVFTDSLQASGLHCMAADHFEKGQRMLAKIRYSDKGQMCVVKEVSGQKIEVMFDEKVRAVTPGQAVVFYQGDIVLGGATIERKQ